MFPFFLILFLMVVVLTMEYTGTRSYVVGAKATTGATMTALTAVDANLSTDATAILAYWACGGLATSTTVESNGHEVQFLLGGQNQIGPFSTQPWSGNGAATNESAVPHYPDVWATMVPQVGAGAIGGMAISAKGMNAAVGTPTGNASMIAGVVTWEGPLPSKDVLDGIRTALALNTTLPMRNGGLSSAASGITANATANPTITVPPDADELVGFSAVHSVDGAYGAGTEVVGWVDWTSTIANFGTQRVPFAPCDASLGTAVGAPTSPPQIFWPCVIPTHVGSGRSQWTLTPTIRLNATIDAASFDTNAFWR